MFNGTAGVTRFAKKAWLDSIVARAADLMVAIFSITTNLNANASDGTPQTYTALVADELGYADSGAASGYTIGGYELSTLNPAVASDGANGYNLTFDDIVTDAGAIPVGDYGAVIYDTTDGNRIVAICAVSVNQGSIGAAMTFGVPDDAIQVD